MSRLTGRCGRTCARNFACWSNASYASTATRPTSRRKRRRRCWSRPRVCPPAGRLETMPAFARYIRIDYPGAQTPTASLKGLRVYLAEGDGPPAEVPPPPSSKKYWTRRGIAEWLVERLAKDVPTLVGIDHGFSFPLRYFEVHGLLHDWA